MNCSVVMIELDVNSQKILLGNAQIRVGFQSLVWSAPSDCPRAYLTQFLPLWNLSLSQSIKGQCMWVTYLTVRQINQQNSILKSLRKIQSTLYSVIAVTLLLGIGGSTFRILHSHPLDHLVLSFTLSMNLCHRHQRHRQHHHL